MCFVNHIMYLQQFLITEEQEDDFSLSSEISATNRRSLIWSKIPVSVLFKIQNFMEMCFHLHFHSIERRLEAPTAVPQIAAAAACVFVPQKHFLVLSRVSACVCPACRLSDCSRHAKPGRDVVFPTRTAISSQLASERLNIKQRLTRFQFCSTF